MAKKLSNAEVDASAIHESELAKAWATITTPENTCTHNASCECNKHLGRRLAYDKIRKQFERKDV